MRSLVIATALLVPIGPWSTSAAEELPWKVGLASVKITPEEPVRLVGYASRTELSRGVAHDLHARALVLEDREGHRAVLVTSDIIGFRGSLADSVCRKISERTGLERRQLLLNSSHTHTGPALGLTEDELRFPGAEARATIAYTRGLQEKVVDLVDRALGRLVPARLSLGTGVATFVMNRREFTDRGVRLGVNPTGLVDRSVPVLRIEGDGGKTLAVLFGAACHCTTLTGTNLEISGDFAGYSQTLVEERLPGALAMFMQGCAGDANPFPRGSEEIARQHGKTLGEEVLRVLETRLRPIRGPLRTELEMVKLPLEPAPSREEVEKMKSGGRGWQGFVGTRMAEILEREGKLPGSYTAPIALWQFGQDWTLVALPGEVVVDYVTFLERALGPLRLWVAAYSNDVFGYLPSARVIAEGGYETRGLYAGGIGFFSPAAEKVVVERVTAMARRAGRKLPPRTK